MSNICIRTNRSSTRASDSAVDEARRLRQDEVSAGRKSATHAVAGGKSAGGPPRMMMRVGPDAGSLRSRTANGLAERECAMGTSATRIRVLPRSMLERMHATYRGAQLWSVSHGSWLA
jgi:hypothetical protein